MEGATHKQVVDLIKSGGDVLTLTVISVTQQVSDALIHWLPRQTYMCDTNDKFYTGPCLILMRDSGRILHCIFIQGVSKRSKYFKSEREANSGAGEGSHEQYFLEGSLNF